MTVIYIHGVKVRDERQGIELGKSFRRWLQPKLEVDGATIGYEPVYWGNKAAKFRCDLQSRPQTALLGMGAADGYAGLGSLRSAGPQSPLDRLVPAPQQGPVIGGPQGSLPNVAPPLASIARSRRADFLADLYLAIYPVRSGSDPVADEPDLGSLADAAASVADAWDAVAARNRTDDARITEMMTLVEQRLNGPNLIGMGGAVNWLSRAGETMRRAASWPFDAVSTAFAELRPTVNEFVAYFIGDVLTYLNERGTAENPGEVPLAVLRALRLAQNRKKETGEKIVAVTHSMGGQLFYDAITYFAKADPLLQDLEVDHWISCGSQVSFFAELQLLHGQPDRSSPGKLDRPDRVKAWTNFYDTNDLVGFVMSPVFNGVEDQAYDTGYGLAFAHTGFLARPSFFQAIHDVL
ncbi:hypothetical protein [Agrobacterium salinitolerans]|uniref:hypothetical protein n=1 Tax=Agrobacterium salinitolerans TaxID=1183413 RepID=UPI001055E9DA|nr:hypothetical protein [Agrobacterium salinitolerans]